MCTQNQPSETGLQPLRFKLAKQPRVLTPQSCHGRGLPVPQPEQRPEFGKACPRTLVLLPADPLPGLGWVGRPELGRRGTPHAQQLLAARALFALQASSKWEQPL